MGVEARGGRRRVHPAVYAAVAAVAITTLLGVLVWAGSALWTPRSSAPPPPGTSPSASAVLPSPSPPAPSASPSAAPSPSPKPSPAVMGRRIVINLTTQHLWAYEDGVTIVDTVVATGRPELPTVTGSFRILNKHSPFEFISPWPPGSPYWYASAWVSYAIAFESSGYFIHDAPWRTVWGPGANVKDGSHGCVNVPLAPMEKLYRWARVGDLVVVQP